MKKIIAVGIATIFTCGLTGCNWFQPAEPVKPTEPTKPVVEESTATKTPNQAPGLIQPQDQPSNMIYAPGADKL